MNAKEGDLKEIYKAVLELDPLPPSASVKTTSKTLKKITDAKTEVKQRENISNLSTIVQNFDNRTDANKFRNTLPSKVNLSSQSLRGDLDNIVLKALRKETERRYSSAENFSEDIRRHQEGLPVTARPNTFSYRAEKFFKRNKAGVFAGILIVLAIIGGIITTLWQAKIAQTERAKAENRFNDVRNLANSFLFEITPEIENLSGSTRAKELLVKRALEYLDRLNKTSDDFELRRELAAAYEKVGDVQGNPYEANIGDMQGAMHSYEKARAIREKLFANDYDNVELKAELAKNTQLIGDILFFTGEIEKAGEKYRVAVEAQQEIVAQNPDDAAAQFDLASARFALGATYFWNSNYDEALKYYLPAKETLEKLSRSTSENDKFTDKLANSYIRIGETVAWQDKSEEGEQSILKGLTMIEPLVERNPNNGKFRKTLWTANLKAGEIYLDREQFDKCLAHYRKALELAKITANDDPKNVLAKRDLALSYNKVGDTLDSSGNGKAALENARKALALQKEIAAIDPKNFEIRRQIAGTFKRMGYAQTTMKDYENSRRNFQNALEQYEYLSVLDPNDEKIPREIAIVSQTIGETYIAASAKNNKIENLQEGLEWVEKSYKLLSQMKAAGTLPEFDDKLIAEVKAQLDDIKNKLGKNS